MSTSVDMDQFAALVREHDAAEAEFLRADLELERVAEIREAALEVRHRAAKAISAAIPNNTGIALDGRCFFINGYDRAATFSCIQLTTDPLTENAHYG